MEEEVIKVWIEAEQHDAGRLRLVSNETIPRWLRVEDGYHVVPASELQRVPKRLPETEDEWRACIGKTLNVCEDDQPDVLLGVSRNDKKGRLELWIRWPNGNSGTWQASDVTGVEGWVPPVEPEGPDLEALAASAAGWMRLGPWEKVDTRKNVEEEVAQYGGQVCAVVPVEGAQP